MHNVVGFLCYQTPSSTSVFMYNYYSYTIKCLAKYNTVCIVLSLQLCRQLQATILEY